MKSFFCKHASDIQAVMELRKQKGTMERVKYNFNMRGLLFKENFLIDYAPKTTARQPKPRICCVTCVNCGATNTYNLFPGPAPASDNHQQDNKLAAAEQEKKREPEKGIITKMANWLSQNNEK